MPRCNRGSGHALTNMRFHFALSETLPILADLVDVQLVKPASMYLFIAATWVFGDPARRRSTRPTISVDTNSDAARSAWGSEVPGPAGQVALRCARAGGLCLHRRFSGLCPADLQRRNSRPTASEFAVSLHGTGVGLGRDESFPNACRNFGRLGSKCGHQHRRRFFRQRVEPVRSPLCSARGVSGDNAAAPEPAHDPDRFLKHLQANSEQVAKDCRGCVHSSSTTANAEAKATRHHRRGRCCSLCDDGRVNAHRRTRDPGGDTELSRCCQGTDNRPDEGALTRSSTTVIVVRDEC